MASRPVVVWRACLVAGVATVSWGQVRGQTSIPTVFEAGHIYATPRLANGRVLRLIVDTGGGGAWTYWLGQWSPSSRDLSKLDPCKLGSESIEQFRPPVFSGTDPPPPVGPCKGIMILPSEGDDIPSYDGMLGANYLSSHGIWTFDYPNQRLLLEGQAWKADKSARRAPLGFAATPTGLRRGFPRLTISVAGESLDMLLDTGATGHPTAETLAATGEPVANGEGVASYITTSMFNRWQRLHPEWPVIEKGDDLAGPSQATRVIRVPEIEWAELKMGPVWFTERSDGNFHEMMAAMMDRKPEGALGGNVFGHLVLTIDYPREVAWVTCHDASFCQPSVGP